MHITNGHFRISLCFGVGLAGHCGHKGHFIHHGTNFKQSGCKSMILDLLALTLFMGGIHFYPRKLSFRKFNFPHRKMKRYNHLLLYNLINLLLRK